MKFKITIAVLLLFSMTSFQTDLKVHTNVLEKFEQDPPFLTIETPWADSVYATLSLDEKIGQLFNIAAYSNRGTKHTKEILALIEKYKIGGLTFFRGGPVRQAKLTNTYQTASKIPLMIAIDGEWGLSMRLDSTVKYPWQMTLGAIQNDELIYKMGLQIAEQFRRLGVHVNFAPVVDVNNNPKNPVIFARSFGENKENVARKGIAYMRGMQDGGLLANAKHFPGHGDTDKDSHKTLPVVNHSMARIDSLELYPFKQMINKGVGSVMTAHLYLPQLTSTKTASSLTTEIVDTLLQQKMGFQGLVFTDGLNMGGVANFQSSEQIDLQALIAGNDVLLLSQQVEKTVAVIKNALATGKLSLEAINQSSLKILKVKEWLGIHKKSTVEMAHLYEDLNQPKYEFLNRQLTEASLTLVRNKGNSIPIKKLGGKRIVSLALNDGGVSGTTFQTSLNLYAKVDKMSFESIPVAQQQSLLDTLLTYDEVIISIHKSNKHPWVKAEINTEFKNFIERLRRKKRVTLVLFGNAYGLKNFVAAEHTDALVVAYQNSKAAQELSAQLLFGGIAANGKLPVSVSPTLKAGMGQQSALPFRMKYTMPEELDLRSEDLAQIDSIVLEGINEKAYPGAQVLVAKEGKIIYHKTFGSPTYENKRAVQKTDLYDIASVTKITSTLLAIMKLDGEGKLSLDDKLGKLLKKTRGTAYEKLTLREILAHQAGLASWIPFYNKTLIKGQPRYDIYSTEQSKKYPIRVAENFYMIKEYQDTIINRILYRAKVKEEKEYKYSDVGYYLLKEIVEDKVKMSIKEYNTKAFYEPMGLDRLLFNPRERFSLDEIIPTEKDMYFRNQQIHGDVHDPGAAMLGGVGGHAGLFSTANELAKLMQMYLDDGVFQGERYLKKGKVGEYAKCQYCIGDVPQNQEENRRGAGFDKPQFHGNPGPSCECISYTSFGHSGFTGALAWADPTEKVVYVFLSNRIYPDATNKQLLSSNIRTRIQEKIYEAINNSKVRNSQPIVNEIE